MEMLLKKPTFIFRFRFVFNDKFLYSSWTSFLRTPDLIWLVAVLASSVFPHIHVMSDSEHQLHEQLYYFICCTIKLLTTDDVMEI